MPRRPPLPQDEAEKLVTDMLSALESTDSPGFSKFAISGSTIRLHAAERINKHGSKASEQEIEKGEFSGRVTIRMKVEEKMLNQLGNLHGGANATIVDNFTSMALYMHLPDTEPTTPWAFLGVTQSLSVQYFVGIPLDSWIEIESNVVSIGKRIVVINADIWILSQTEKDDGTGDRVQRASTGTQTKVDNSLASKM
ncbi:unnamed protein product [Sympodiomycopsis kandeliae]